MSVRTCGPHSRACLMQLYLGKERAELSSYTISTQGFPLSPQPLIPEGQTRATAGVLGWRSEDIHLTVVLKDEVSPWGSYSRAAEVELGTAADSQRHKAREGRARAQSAPTLQYLTLLFTGAQACGSLQEVTTVGQPGKHK